MRKPLSVLHIGKFYPPHRGGMETHLELLCSELQQHVDLNVLVANDGRETVDELAGGVRVIRLGTQVTVASTSISVGMVRAINSIPADIIHIHHPNPMAMVAYLASNHPASLVVTYHSDIVQQRVLTQPFRPILTRTLDRADAIIATSPNYIDSSSVLRPYRDKCRVVPFGTPTEQFEHPNEDAVRAIKKRYGPRIVLAVCRLVPYKGLRYLVQAMSQVDGRALIIGSGPLRESLMRQVGQLGLTGRVIFMGDVEDLIPYYHAADLFVLPSIGRNEAFGIVQLEAMACRLPVVNTRLASGVPFVSPDGVTGLTVKPKDWEALAGAIQYLLDHYEQRRQFGEQAYLRVRRNFSMQAMAERTLRLYADVHQARLAPVAEAMPAHAKAS